MKKCDGLSQYTVGSVNNVSHDFIKTVGYIKGCYTFIFLHLDGSLATFFQEYHLHKSTPPYCLSQT
jgi:hypothetical protein